MLEKEELHQLVPMLVPVVLHCESESRTEQILQI